MEEPVKWNSVRLVYSTMADIWLTAEELLLYRTPVTNSKDDHVTQLHASSNSLDHWQLESTHESPNLQKWLHNFTIK